MPPEPDADWPLRLEPAEYRELRHAARIFPPLARAQAGLVELTASEVADLRASSQALAFAGAEVALPREIGEETVLELDDAVLTFRDAPLSLSGVVEYDLHAALGGHEISDEELRALAAATRSLVRLGGEWRVLDERALRRARQLAQLALHGGGIPTLTALGATLAGAGEVRGFAVTVDESGEVAGLATRLRDPVLREPLDTGSSFHGELRPYQHAGLGWLVRMRELGLGACWRTTWAWARPCSSSPTCSTRPGGQRPALIVCPVSVLGNWQRELHRFAPDLGGVAPRARPQQPDRRPARRTTSCSPPTRCRRVIAACSATSWGRGGPGRGAAGQEPGHPQAPRPSRGWPPTAASR